MQNVPPQESDALEGKRRKANNRKIRRIKPAEYRLEYNLCSPIYWAGLKIHHVPAVQQNLLFHWRQKNMGLLMSKDVPSFMRFPYIWHRALADSFSICCGALLAGRSSVFFSSNLLFVFCFFLSKVSLEEMYLYTLLPQLEVFWQNGGFGLKSIYTARQ